MTKEEVATALAFLHKINIFQPLPDEAKSRLSRCMRKCHFSAGETIFHPGDEGNSFFIIIDGEISVQLQQEDGAFTEVACLEAEEVFGQYPILTDEPHRTLTVTTSAADLFEIRREDIEPLLEEFPALYEQLWSRKHKRQTETASYEEVFVKHNVNPLAYLEILEGSES